MPPSYSVRRGRLTAQLTCRTGTSYTPVKHARKYFYLIYSLIHYYLFTNSVGQGRPTEKKREARNRFGYAPHNAWQRATLPQATPAVPSPLGLFTSVFGMGTGVTSSLWPPGKSVLLIKELISIRAHKET